MASSSPLVKDSDMMRMMRSCSDAGARTAIRENIDLSLGVIQGNVRKA